MSNGKRVVASAVGALGMAVVGAAGAPAAHAANDAYGVACFVQSAGGAFAGGAVQVQVLLSDNTWWPLLDQTTASSGCVETSLGGGFTYRYAVAQHFFSGVSEPQAVFTGESHRYDVAVTWQCDPSRISVPVNCPLVRP